MNNINIIPESVLHFTADGTGVGLYTEAIDLQRVGALEMCRASTVEFNEATQKWEVFDSIGSGRGRLLHTDPSRAACLAWERRYFNAEGRRTAEAAEPAKPAEPATPPNPSTPTIH